MLTTTTLSRETCDVLKLVSSSSPSHEPSPAPNDPYTARYGPPKQRPMAPIPPEMATKAPSLQMVGRVDRCIRAGRLCTLEPQHQPRSNARTRLARSIGAAQHNREDCYGLVGLKVIGWGYVNVSGAPGPPCQNVKAYASQNSAAARAPLVPVKRRPTPRPHPLALNDIFEFAQ